jgi:dienelactone hydrolase
MTKLPLLALAAALSAPAAATAAIETRTVDYQAGQTTLQGFVAHDGAVKGKRPGVLVVHEWWGHNEHARNQARRLAEAGYVGFALDMYGKGKVAKHPEDAKAFSAEATKDAATVKARFDAALAELKRQPQVDPERIAVFGYCMGGTIALQMARAGEDLDAVATFHAGLAPKGPPAEKGRVKARILVNNGAADPYVPKEQIEAFEAEMKAAGARYEVVSYPGVKHSFTNPEADKHGMDALAYDKAADEKSWAASMAMLGEVFGKGK